MICSWNTVWFLKKRRRSKKNWQKLNFKYPWKNPIKTAHRKTSQKYPNTFGLWMNVCLGMCVSVKLSGIYLRYDLWIMFRDYRQGNEDLNMDTRLINRYCVVVLCRCGVDLVLWIEERDFRPEVKTWCIPVLGSILFSWPFLQAQLAGNFPGLRKRNLPVSV